MELMIDSEFRDLIPPLSNEELMLLENSLLVDGLRDPVLVWDGIVVDGHNRIRICMQNGIDVHFKEMEFLNRDAAKDWIIANQLSRRNLNDRQARFLRGTLYNRLKKSRGGDRSKHQNDTLKPTAETLAGKYDVSAITIKRDGQYAEALTRLEKMAGNKPDLIGKLQKATAKKVIMLAGEVKGAKDLVAALKGKDADKTPKPMIAKSLKTNFKLMNKPFLESHELPLKEVKTLITKLPYEEDANVESCLGICKDLAVTAKKVLRDDGVALLFTDPQIIPEIIEIFQQHLSYQTLIATLDSSGQNWQPLLVFTIGKQLPPAVNLVNPRSSEVKGICMLPEMDPVIAKLIEIFTNSGDLVFDPMMDKGGSGFSAIAMGRKYIGFEADQAIFKETEAQIKKQFEN